MQKLKIAAFWSATGRGLHVMTAFLSPAAFEQRHRDRQRRALVAELDGLDEQARYDRARRPVLTDALQVLSREDMAATLPKANFIFCTSHKDALRPQAISPWGAVVRYEARPVRYGDRDLAPLTPEQLNLLRETITPDIVRNVDHLRAAISKAKGL